MSQDPYGWKDDRAPPDLHADARSAMWLGVSAAMLGSIGICFCYIPYFVALPLGLLATVRGWRAFNAARPDTDERSMAQAGLVSGALSSGVSGAFVLFCLMYAVIFVLYFVFVFVLLGVAAVAGPAAQ